MGNCLCLSALTPNRDSSKDEKILRIVTMDGKILEYRASILVKDLLLNFDHCRVAVSQNTLQRLPPYYELKVGHMYYLHPSDGQAGSVPAGSPASDSGARGGSKRIKVVISKQQLQELMSNNTSVEEVLSSLQRGTRDYVDSVTGWKPKLETIPEGIESMGR